MLTLQVPFKVAVKKELKFVLNIWTKEKHAKHSPEDFDFEGYGHEKDNVITLHRNSNPFMHINVLKP